MWAAARAHLKEQDFLLEIQRSRVTALESAFDAELAALEQVEATDGLASSHRIRQLRRKRARLAKRASKLAQVEHSGNRHHTWSMGFRGTGLAALREGAEPQGLAGVGGFVEAVAAQGELDLALGALGLVPVPKALGST